MNERSKIHRLNKKSPPYESRKVSRAKLETLNRQIDYFLKELNKEADLYVQSLQPTYQFGGQHRTNFWQI